METKKVLIPGNPEDAKNYFKNKISFTVGPVDISHFRETGEEFVLVDVRSADDFAKGHPAGAINLPREQWDSYAGLEKNKVNIVLCYSQTCHLGARAALKFAAHGYPVMEMEGGFAAWEEFKMPIEAGEAKRRSA